MMLWGRKVWSTLGPNWNGRGSPVFILASFQASGSSPPPGQGVFTAFLSPSRLCLGYQSSFRIAVSLRWDGTATAAGALTSLFTLLANTLDRFLLGTLMDP